MVSEPVFGVRFKGHRLGYQWSDKHGCFIRMSTINDSIFIELAPSTGIPNKSPVKLSTHRCWWDDGGQIFQHIPWLDSIVSVKKFIAVEVNDDGDIIRELTK